MRGLGNEEHAKKLSTQVFFRLCIGSSHCSSIHLACSERSIFIYSILSYRIYFSRILIEAISFPSSRCGASCLAQKAITTSNIRRSLPIHFISMRQVTVVVQDECEVCYLRFFSFMYICSTNTEKHYQHQPVRLLFIHIALFSRLNFEY